MNNLLSILTLGIGVVVLISGVIAFMLFAPKPSTDRAQWFKESLLSSCLLMFGVFIFLISTEASELYSGQYEAVWNSILSMLVFIIPTAIIFALGLYFRTIILEKYIKLGERLARFLKDRIK